MVTFFIALAVLILGYFIYGNFVEKLFGADPQRATPATTMADGVDYVPMKPWRIFLIQFLNIAGVGPIIGAIMGRSLVQPLSFGLCWVASSPVPSTTIWLA